MVAMANAGNFRKTLKSKCHLRDPGKSGRTVKCTFKKLGIKM
jgi:hypothetical protein